MAKHSYTTNIIGGKYRGKKIKIPAIDTTRSSKARLKESFFNRLQFDIMGAVFVEMFAGSGSVGLEALSRGAEKIYFLEKNKTAFATLRQNVDAMEPQKCELLFGDSFENIKQVIKTLRENGEKAYFYLDPPFAIREGMDDIYKQTLAAMERLPKEIVRMVTIEHMTGLKLPRRIGALEKEKSKKFGKTTLSYYV